MFCRESGRACPEQSTMRSAPAARSSSAMTAEIQKPESSVNAGQVRTRTSPAPPQIT